MSTTTPQRPPQFAEQVPPDNYQTPPVTLVVAITMPSIEGPGRIRLRLEGGYGLEIPMKQDAIDTLFGLLQSFATKNNT